MSNLHEKQYDKDCEPIIWEGQSRIHTFELGCVLEDVVNPAGGKGSANAASWSMEKINGDNTLARLQYHSRPAQLF